MTIEQLVAIMLCLIVLHFSLSVSVNSIKNIKNTISQFDDLSVFESIISYIDSECKNSKEVKYITYFYAGTLSSPYFIRKGILINYNDKNGNNQCVIYYIFNDGIYREKVENFINSIYVGSSEVVCNNLKIRGIDITSVENKIYIESKIKKQKYQYIISM